MVCLAVALLSASIAAPVWAAQSPARAHWQVAPMKRSYAKSRRARREQKDEGRGRKEEEPSFWGSPPLPVLSLSTRPQGPPLPPSPARARFVCPQIANDGPGALTMPGFGAVFDRPERRVLFSFFFFFFFLLWRCFVASVQTSKLQLESELVGHSSPQIPIKKGKR